jgi:hypothetical protein
LLKDGLKNLEKIAEMNKNYFSIVGVRYGTPVLSRENPF